MAEEQGLPQGEAPQKPAGSASQLVTEVHSKMSELMGMFDQAPQLKAEQQQMGQLLAGFEQLVESMGSGPGEEAPTPQNEIAPVEAGAADVRPVV